MRLAALLRIFDSLLQDILRFLNELPVQIDGIVRYSSRGIVLSEDVIRRLFVVLLHLDPMLLSFLREVVRCCTITTFVGLTRLGFLVRKVEEGNWVRSSTLSKHAPRFAASARARSRKRSYSASASPLVEWLKAVGGLSVHGSS